MNPVTGFFFCAETKKNTVEAKKKDSPVKKENGGKVRGENEVPWRKKFGLGIYN